MNARPPSHGYCAHTVIFFLNKNKEEQEEKNKNKKKEKGTLDIRIKLNGSWGGIAENFSDM